LLTVFYSDFVDFPLPEKHAFPRQKYRLAREAVERLPAGLGVRLRRAPAVAREELLHVHTSEYIDQVMQGELPDKQQRAIGFPWSPELVQRSLHSVGATLAAAGVAVGSHALPSGTSSGNDNPRQWAAHLAGGTHHAFADRGQGFCIFNDAAVAIRMLQASGQIERAIVIDCDVHQGNGTAAIFAGDSSVFTFSIHGAKNFPLHKQASDLDVPLPDGCNDGEYLARLEPALADAWRCGPFDAVIYIAGADPYRGDKYGRMQLTKRGLQERDRLVLERCRSERVPTVTVMGGGYARDVRDVAEIHLETIREAALQSLAL